MGRILTLEDSHDSERVGALCAYLAILARANIPVVPGFVIPIGESLENGLSNEILRHFEELRCESAVLRTSSVLHDLDGETLRDVKREALIDAVRYLQNNVLRRGRRAAILVQHNLEAELSGTAHTANPVTQNEDEYLIEAHLWMNDTVLGGASEPDIIIVNRRTGALVSEMEDEGETLLAPRQIEELFTTLRKIEKRSAIPLSVDWAFNNQKLYILRVRPINKKTEERYQSDSNN